MTTTARELDPDKARIAIEAEIGQPDSITRAEHNYRCPFCLKAGYSRQSHLHIAWVRGVATCHQCGYGARNIRSIVLAVFGRMPSGVTKRLDSGGDMVDEVERILFGSKKKIAKGDSTPEIHLPESFTLLTEKPKDRLGRVVLDYLLNRGVPYRRLSEIGAGYCTDSILRGYAVFPIHVNGHLISYTSRRVTGIGPKVRHARAGSAASAALFNYDNVRRARRLFVGEGPFDAWALHRRLLPTDGGVSTLGTLLHDEQARLIGELPCEEVYIWYDADAMAKATAAAKRLSSIAGKTISIIRHEDADPDELPEKVLKRLVRDAEPYQPFMSDIATMCGVT